MKNAAVILRPQGAGGWGHVGFAFITHQGQCCVGGIEGNHSLPYSPDNGMWYVYVDYKRAMDELLARDYKEFRWVLGNGHDNLANTKTAEWKHKHYDLANQNCGHGVYYILTAFGCALPRPRDFPKPNDWYTAIGGTRYPVSSGYALFADNEKMAAESLPPDPFE